MSAGPGLPPDALAKLAPEVRAEVEHALGSSGTWARLTHAGLTQFLHVGAVRKLEGATASFTVRRVDGAVSGDVYYFESSAALTQAGRVLWQAEQKLPEPRLERSTQNGSFLVRVWTEKAAHAKDVSSVVSAIAGEE